MNSAELKKLVADEIKELETKDVDQLYGCLQDTLSDLGIETSNDLDTRLYAEIERQINNPLAH